MKLKFLDVKVHEKDYDKLFRLKVFLRDLLLTCYS